MLAGWVTDKLGCKMKVMMVLITALGAISILWFVIITEKWLPFAPFLQQLVYIWCSAVIPATLVNAGVPLSLEITADSAYLVSEMTASSVMLWLYNVFSMLLLFCTQILPDPAIASFLVLGAFVLSVPLLQFSVSSTNQRMQIDSNNEDVPPQSPDSSTYISFVPDKTAAEDEPLSKSGSHHSLYGAIGASSHA